MKLTKKAIAERELISAIAAVSEEATTDEAIAKLKLEVHELERRRDLAKRDAERYGDAWRHTKAEAEKLRAWLNSHGTAEREERTMKDAEKLWQALYEAKLEIDWCEYDPTVRACKAWDETRACIWRTR